MSLRKANGARLEKSGFWLFATHRFVFAGTQHFSFTDHEFRQARASLRREGVARIGRDGDRTLWWTDAGFFWDDEDLSPDDVGLLVWDRGRRQDARLERLRKIRASEKEIEGARRERIPDDVRAFVWGRDEGRCVRCDSADDLQFDHVIPVARGGGSSTNNIQILCGDCNRQKSDSIV